ncbi:MAG: hypothetical protein ACLU4J_10550 [Butyricimonas paravirosa]
MHDDHRILKHVEIEAGGDLAIDVIRTVLSNRYQEIIREDEGGAYG